MQTRSQRSSDQPREMPDRPKAAFGASGVGPAAAADKGQSGPRPSRRARPSALGWQGVTVAGAILVYALALRMRGLSERAFWVDEAESSINALSILEQGVPTDRYLGMPVYENALIDPWPAGDADAAEYEFRDSSYSSKHVTLFHGWLPLYTIAGAFEVAGVKPDTDTANRQIVRSTDEMRRRTWAARAPSVVFGMAFLVATFLAARRIYGADAGWAALAAGAVLRPAIEFSRLARYYASTLALSAGCGLALWSLLRKGRWRDAIAAGVLLGLLFHAHLLSFVVLIGVTALICPAILRRHGQAPLKLAAMGGIVLAMTLPWLALSGFFETPRSMPLARQMMSPRQVLAYPLKLWPVVLVGSIAVAGLVFLNRFRSRLPSRWVRPVAQGRGGFLLLAAWAALACVAFVLLVPAPSYFSRRLTLILVPPGLLFAAMLFAAIGRIVMPRYPRLSGAAAALLLVATLAAGHQASFGRFDDPLTPKHTYEVIDALRQIPIPPGTRVYCTPGDHLPLTFYTGIPIQSIAPIRKSFFDGFPRDVMVIEAGRLFDPLTPMEARAAALAGGARISLEDAGAAAHRIDGALIRENLSGRVASIAPPATPLPAYAPILLAAQRLKTVELTAVDVALAANPMLDGYTLANHGEWWPIYFYRFVHPEQRTGPHLNYADRIRNGQAYLLPEEWVLIHSPPPHGN